MAVEIAVAGSDILGQSAAVAVETIDGVAEGESHFRVQRYSTPEPAFCGWIVARKNTIGGGGLQNRPTTAFSLTNSLTNGPIWGLGLRGYAHHGPSSISCQEFETMISETQTLFVRQCFLMTF